jgi:hypothetical protein
MVSWTVSIWLFSKSDGIRTRQCNLTTFCLILEDNVVRDIITSSTTNTNNASTLRSLPTLDSYPRYEFEQTIQQTNSSLELDRNDMKQQHSNHSHIESNLSFTQSLPILPKEIVEHIFSFIDYLEVDEFVRLFFDSFTHIKHTKHTLLNTLIFAQLFHSSSSRILFFSLKLSHYHKHTRTHIHTSNWLFQPFYRYQTISKHWRKLVLCKPVRVVWWKGKYRTQYHHIHRLVKLTKQIQLMNLSRTEVIFNLLCWFSSSSKERQQSTHCLLIWSFFLTLFFFRYQMRHLQRWHNSRL